MRARILGARSILRSHRTRIVLIVGLLLAIVVVANAPTTTSVFVDYRPEPVTQPLYAKVISFFHRDIQMRQLADRIAGDARGPREKAERLLRWTNANVRRTPAGMPVVDDHPYHIVVRGYGEPDQAADVFANLAAYAGIDGGLVRSVAENGSILYAFAVLEIDGAQRLFDVREGHAFRDRNGALASVDELRRDLTLVDGLRPPSEARGVPYAALISRLEAGPHRRPSDQMPLSRLLNELGRILSRR
ncbi:MAG: hypothetical protein HY553_10085 [Elusimicrobia bacterium]|nr:hypothetical protein [Elusimicrobiota bacterium]